MRHYGHELEVVLRYELAAIPHIEAAFAQYIDEEDTVRVLVVIEPNDVSDLINGLVDEALVRCERIIAIERVHEDADAMLFFNNVKRLVYTTHVDTFWRSIPEMLVTAYKDTIGLPAQILWKQQSSNEFVVACVSGADDNQPFDAFVLQSVVEDLTDIWLALDQPGGLSVTPMVTDCFVPEHEGLDTLLPYKAIVRSMPEA